MSIFTEAFADTNGTYQVGSIEPVTFSDVPAGEYRAMITDTEEKINSKATGKFLQLTLSIIDGAFKGQKLFTILNLVNQNPVAVKIAKGELESICRATGVVGVLKDQAQIINKPMVVRVACDPALQEGRRNSIKGYKKIEGAQQTSGQRGDDVYSAAPPASLSPVDTNPPW